MAVKHGAGAFTGMMMRVRCVYRIKIRSWGGVTDPKVSSAIMVGHWATAIIKVLYLENQTFEDWKQNARRQNADSLV